VRELQILSQSELPTSNFSRELEGYLHGGVGLCLILVDVEPGRGPSLHRHQYDEVFIVQEGVATFVAGEVERKVAAGEIVIVPAGLPHRFWNSGDGPLRQVDIHLSERFATEWL
jgi:mannose-6-phosphate isomerase-like protein (cupin superfamily)